MRRWAYRGLGLHCVGHRLVDGMQVEKSPPPHREGRAGPNVKALGYWVWELTGDVGDPGQCSPWGTCLLRSPGASVLLNWWFRA